MERRPNVIKVKLYLFFLQKERLKEENSESTIYKKGIRMTLHTFEHLVLLQLEHKPDDIFIAHDAH